jgi:adenine-specific DNA methylase
MLRNRSAVALDLPDGSVDFVVTDPPYFDSVQYGDLAAFFRVWLRQLLPAALLPAYAPGAAAVDPRRADEIGYAYRPVLGGIFAECRRVLRAPHGRLVFTFHHARAAGWRALTLALRDAGFVLVNRYAVHAENPRSVHMRGTGAVTHDAILVLAPRAWAPEAGWDRPLLPLAPFGDDSATFVRECASLLGYLLAANLSEAQIGTLWQEAVG